MLFGVHKREVFAMQTKQDMFLDLMGQTDTQFIIPVYQRSKMPYRFSQGGF